MAKITEEFYGPDDPIFSEGVTLFSPKGPVKPMAANPKLKKLEQRATPPDLSIKPQTESGEAQIIFFRKIPQLPKKGNI